MSSGQAIAAVSPGHYAVKQLRSRSWLIAWSHRSRFEVARELARPFAGKRLLDYGCGDGTFLAAVSDLFPNPVGADLDPTQVQDCRARFPRSLGASFAHISELRRREHCGRYEVVTCMEVLEHCVESMRLQVIADLARMAARGGIVIVSVPIEIGPTLAAKQAVRAVAGWRKLGDYEWRERYTAREMARMLFAGSQTAIERPVYRDASGANPWHGHKGFNWRRLRLELLERFEIAEIRFSPLPWLRGLLSSQAWFVCRPK